MIYIYKTNEGILFSETREEGLDLLSLENLDLHKIGQDLRYYKILGKPGEWYKDCQEVRDYIDKKQIRCASLSYIYLGDIKGMIDKFQEDLGYLIDTEILGEDVWKDEPVSQELLDLVVYKCDVINLLYDSYGTRVVNLVRGYQKLSDLEKQFLYELYSLDTKEKKTDYIRKNIFRVGPEHLQPYLPAKENLNLRIFRIHPKERDLWEESPEYRDQRRIDGMSKTLDNREYYIRQEVYQTFSLGDVWEGSRIKEELARIYEKYESPDKSRVHDIFEFFETAITRKGYRLMTRKL